MDSRDDPAEHPEVRAEELALITSGRTHAEGPPAHAGTLRKLAGDRGAWALCLSYFSNSYGAYFVMTWLPTYLAEQRGFKQAALAVFSGLPLLLSVVAALLGGLTTDFLARKFGLRFGRCSIGVVGYLVAGSAMVLAAQEQDSRHAAILIALATAASMFPLAAHWAAAIDIGRVRSGVLSACMNTTGQMGSILSPYIAAYLVQNYSNWALPLYVMASLYAFSSVCWLLVHPPAGVHRYP